jgi:Domain of unknown function (DUF4383)
MVHIPVNHPMQPLYRALAVACGVYVLIFGIAGVVQSRGLDMFAMTGTPWVLGLRANRAFSVASIVAGSVIIAGGLIGRNLDHWVNLLGGIGFLVAGMAMMTLLRTDLNVFGFSMTTCIVSFIIGVALFTSGLYGKTGSTADVRAEESFRHGGHLNNNSNNA